ELWSTSWDYWAGDGELFFETQGKSLPYRFRKNVRVEDNAIMLAYEIENTGSEEFAFLWSAHPLLAVEASCRIVLPEEVSGLFVEWSRGERLGKFGDNCGWQGWRESGSFGTARCERSHGRQSIYLPIAGGVLRALLSPDKGNHRISFQSTGRSVFRNMDLPGRLAVPGERAFHSRIGGVYRVSGLSSRGGT